VSLEQQTGDVLQQGRHGYPKMQRDMINLLHASQSAQARTSRLRSQEEQAAATRILALHGLNGGRCVRTSHCHYFNSNLCSADSVRGPTGSTKAVGFLQHALGSGENSSGTRDVQHVHA
jgi:hypothetical protein